MKKRYQDLVIKNGTFIGDWDRLYSEFENPWQQADDSVVNSKSRRKVLEFIKFYNIHSIVEIGCGLGFTTEFLFANSKELSILGVDISKNAIEKAAINFPHLAFNEADISEAINFKNY
jgi:trans-aconitate methyltransferase